MLKSDMFYVRNNAVKSVENFDMLEHVKSLVRNTELAKAEKSTAFVNGKDALESAHADIDIMTCEDSVINDVLKLEAGSFIKARKEVLDLRSEVADYIPLDKVTSLCLTDKVHVTLMAHAICKSVVLDADIFDTEKGGVDIKKPIQAYYNSGSMRTLKDALRPVFAKLLGADGDYFYAVKTAKSDFEEKDLRNFLASFGGSARRACSKKDGSVEWGSYDYTDRSGSKKLQASAFTTLCAVVLDNASKHNVVKPETAPENQAETPVETVA